MNKKDQYYRLISSGDKNARLDLIEQLPDNSMKESARPLIGSSNPTVVLLSFGVLLPSYCHGADCSTGVALGLALYRYGKELFLSRDYPDFSLTTILSYASCYLTALLNLGSFQEAFNFIEAELPFWEDYENNPEKLNVQEQNSFFDELKSILVAKVNALIQLNRIDEAWNLAFDKRVEGNWASDIELKRLRTNLKRIKRNVGELDKDESQRRKESNEDQLSSSNEMLESLKTMLEKSGMDSSMVDKIKQSTNLDPYTRSGFDSLENILTRGESFLKKKTNEINEITLRQNIRRASGIFVDKQPSENEILNSLAILKDSLQSAIELNNKILINDAYYGLYLCYSRLNDSSKAADQLIELRKNLEKIRKSISNPLLRGGVFQSYPYLFYSMVEHLYKVDRFEDMFDAIEGSKGRAIIDELEKESLVDFQDYNLTNIYKRLKQLLIKENTHYISYHVDDECSYAIFITKNGNISSYQIPIGKRQLTKWYDKNLNNPFTWSTHTQFSKIDIIHELNPFVSWLKEFYETNIINQNDHICYSADHLLYLFPLHFLRINQKPLLELSSVSRVHNAGNLMNILLSPNAKPSSCLSIEVPSTDDIQKPLITESFGYSSLKLKEIFGSDFTRLSNTEASIEKVLDSSKDNQLIHFSTHGFFPLKDNPFINSGLLLSDDKKLPTLYLPDPNYKYNEEGLHLLSPERLLIMFKDIRFNSGYISLQSCVAGYAREGIGGDALGIEWAFLQKGVTTLISTFWNIDIKNANEFYKYYYEEWLVNGLTKGQAHQKAVLKLKNSFHSDDLPDEFFWAGFGLIGDWR